MRLNSTLLAVRDMDRSLAFYQSVLGLDVELDFGANKTLTGGLVLQTLETWESFLGTDEISFGGRDAELYFEEDAFDRFLEHLKSQNVSYVHPVTEHAWGQRAVRFYDPDRHIIEVGENLQSVCCRFRAQGMTEEQIAERMDVPLHFVKSCISF